MEKNPGFVWERVNHIILSFYDLWKKALRNTVGKGVNFLTVFLPLLGQIPSFELPWICSQFILAILMSLQILVAGKWMSCNPFQNKPWFLHVCNSTSLLKTLWEKDKLLVTSNSSFFPPCFLPIWITFCHFRQI